MLRSRRAGMGCGCSGSSQQDLLVSLANPPGSVNLDADAVWANRTDAALYVRRLHGSNDTRQRELLGYTINRKG